MVEPADVAILKSEPCEVEKICVSFQREVQQKVGGVSLASNSVFLAIEIFF